eukprot:TRINITY_DN5651_c0_g1_i2.p1 TRINITY_DN5651_c0_g1~~TRINITY_DN5651_c0_g1_i2.p1  ORF type:complete len:1468 (+),score=263.47 TRINITY_DN5651_c0_g1_i2:68-4471(+)
MMSLMRILCFTSLIAACFAKSERCNIIPSEPSSASLPSWHIMTKGLQRHWQPPSLHSYTPWKETLMSLTWDALKLFNSSSECFGIQFGRSSLDARCMLLREVTLQRISKSVADDENHDTEADAKAVFVFEQVPPWIMTQEAKERLDKNTQEDRRELAGDAKDWEERERVIYHIKYKHTSEVVTNAKLHKDPNYELDKWVMQLPLLENVDFTSYKQSWIRSHFGWLELKGLAMTAQQQLKESMMALRKHNASYPEGLQTHRCRNTMNSSLGMTIRSLGRDAKAKLASIQLHLNAQLATSQNDVRKKLGQVYSEVHTQLQGVIAKVQKEAIGLQDKYALVASLQHRGGEEGRGEEGRGSGRDTVLKGMMANAEERARNVNRSFRILENQLLACATTPGSAECDVGDMADHITKLGHVLKNAATQDWQKVVSAPLVVGTLLRTWRQLIQDAEYTDLVLKNVTHLSGLLENLLSSLETVSSQAWNQSLRTFVEFEQHLDKKHVNPYLEQTSIDALVQHMHNFRETFQECLEQEGERYIDCADKATNEIETLLGTSLPVHRPLPDSLSGCVSSLPMWYTKLDEAWGRQMILERQLLIDQAQQAAVLAESLEITVPIQYDNHFGREGVLDAMIDLANDHDSKDRQHAMWSLLWDKSIPEALSQDDSTKRSNGRHGFFVYGQPVGLDVAPAFGSTKLAGRFQHALKIHRSKQESVFEEELHHIMQMGVPIEGHSQMHEASNGNCTATLRAEASISADLANEEFRELYSGKSLAEAKAESVWCGLFGMFCCAVWLGALIYVERRKQSSERSMSKWSTSEWFKFCVWNKSEAGMGAELRERFVLLSVASLIAHLLCIAMLTLNRLRCHCMSGCGLGPHYIYMTLLLLIKLGEIWIYSQMEVAGVGLFWAAFLSALGGLALLNMYVDCAFAVLAHSCRGFLDFNGAEIWQVEQVVIIFGILLFQFICPLVLAEMKPGYLTAIMMKMLGFDLLLECYNPFATPSETAERWPLIQDVKAGKTFQSFKGFNQTKAWVAIAFALVRLLSEDCPKFLLESKFMGSADPKYLVWASLALGITLSVSSLPKGIVYWYLSKDDKASEEPDAKGFVSIVEAVGRRFFQTIPIPHASAREAYWQGGVSAKGAFFLPSGEGTLVIRELDISVECKVAGDDADKILLEGHKICMPGGKLYELPSKPTIPLDDKMDAIKAVVERLADQIKEDLKIRYFEDTKFHELYSADTDECTFLSGVSAIHDFIVHVGKARNVSPSDIKEYNLKLEEELKKLPANDIHKLAVLFWTTYCELDGSELCSLINFSIREDTPPSIEKVVSVCRIINKFIVSKRSSEIPWPADFKTYRGLGMPREHFSFFKKGKVYRAPMYVASSGQRKVAERFMRKHGKGEMCRVMITIEFDKARKCGHVSYLESITSCKGEEEFLMPPYSGFRVISAEFIPDGVSELRIFAFPDNKSAELKRVPLAPWH